MLFMERQMKARDVYKRQVGRQFDFIGDVETEEMILVDGDESLCLGYTGVEVYKDVYVGDMMEYKATLTHIGNTSRDCHIEVFKLATPAYREGNAKEDCLPGEMVWFDEPVLCSAGNVRLVVKKHLQRGEQPDGTVAEPWADNEDFPEVGFDKDHPEDITSVSYTHLINSVCCECFIKIPPLCNFSILGIGKKSR